MVNSFLQHQSSDLEEHSYILGNDHPSQIRYSLYRGIFGALDTILISQQHISLGGHIVELWGYPYEVTCPYFDHSMRFSPLI